MSHRIGVQLIVFGSRPDEDLSGVLADCAAAGYDGAEIGTLNKTMPVAGIKRAFADSGLALTAVHGGYADMADPAMVDQLVELVKEMGSRHLICSGVAKEEGIKAYEVAAETFNRVGQVCKDAGVTFCYHNHAWEFECFGGVKGIHRLMECTRPDLVKLCTDVYWVRMGEECPREFIMRYRDRAGYYHFKDGGKHGDKQWWWVELGNGTVDIPDAWAAAQEAGCEWLVVEQDRSDKDPAVSAKESFDYLKSIGV